MRRVALYGWFKACTQPVRDVVTKQRRLSLAGRKPRISPALHDSYTFPWNPCRTFKLSRMHGLWVMSQMQSHWCTCMEKFIQKVGRGSNRWINTECIHVDSLLSLFNLTIWTVVVKIKCGSFYPFVAISVSYGWLILCWLIWNSINLIYPKIRYST